MPPTVPVLLQILSGVRNAHEILPPGSIFSLPRNVTVEVQMPGGVIGGAHPIHLHGVGPNPILTTNVLILLTPSITFGSSEVQEAI